VKAQQRYAVQIKAIVIQEAELDGIWIHRLLANGIQSQVVDARKLWVNSDVWGFAAAVRS